MSAQVEALTRDGWTVKAEGHKGNLEYFRAVARAASKSGKTEAIIVTPEPLRYVVLVRRVTA